MPLASEPAAFAMQQFSASAAIIMHVRRPEIPGTWCANRTLQCVRTHHQQNYVTDLVCCMHAWNITLTMHHPFEPNTLQSRLISSKEAAQVAMVKIFNGSGLTENPASSAAAPRLSVAQGHIYMHACSLAFSYQLQRPACIVLQIML